MEPWYYPRLNLQLPTLNPKSANHKDDDQPTKAAEPLSYSLAEKFAIATGCVLRAFCSCRLTEGMSFTDTRVNACMHTHTHVFIYIYIYTHM